MPHPAAKLSLSSFLVLLSVSAATAQAPSPADECEKLKIEVAKLKFENANLRKGLLATPGHQAALAGTAGGPAQSGPAPAEQRQTVQKVTLALVKCAGNAKAQTVTVTLLLTNAGPTQDLQFEQVTAVDEQG